MLAKQVEDVTRGNMMLAKDNAELVEALRALAMVYRSLVDAEMNYDPEDVPPYKEAARLLDKHKG